MNYMNKVKIKSMSFDANYRHFIQILLYLLNLILLSVYHQRFNFLHNELEIKFDFILWYKSYTSWLMLSVSHLLF